MLEQRRCSQCSSIPIFFAHMQHTSDYFMQSEQYNCDFFQIQSGPLSHVDTKSNMDAMHLQCDQTT